MTTSTDSNILLQVRDLSVRYSLKGRDADGKRKSLLAVDNVSFDIERGRTLGIVGESGSGKTTAAMAVARLVEKEAGSLIIDGTDFGSLSGDELRRARQRVQIIFQDPYSSLNPRLRAEDIVREPLRHAGDTSRAEQDEIIDELFAAVGLRPEQKRLFPHQFSGGQRQRIGIARAIAPRPSLIICDEPVSALDVAVQAQILNLLKSLQRKFDLTYLFISHDLGVVQHMCDDIAVMYMGQFVERAQREAFFAAQRHPYSQALLSAVPKIETRAEAVLRHDISGPPPDLTKEQIECRFARRCPHVTDICRTSVPALLPTGGDHQTACHLVDN
ncbi:ABC transporter ATP-binding protein [Alphaproteobacteria bacterium]|nr:ABC transporter ATP-binding protein [Alphaproteobacteria bacterium]